MSFVRRLFGQQDDNADQSSPSASEDEVKGKTDASKNAATSQAKPDIVVHSAESLSEGNDQQLLQDSVVPDARVAFTSPRALEGAPSPRARGLAVGYASDVGRMRPHNEDTLVATKGVHLGDDASDPFGFFVVADGMGGHRAGEVASSLAARLVSHDVLSRVYLPFLLNKTPGTDMAPITDILRDAVKKANDHVHEQVPGGGTTLTCALILGRRAYIAHVGDSRAYLLSNHGIQQVTQDHSYVGRLIELGELSPEEAAVHPQRHVLYRAIGQGENLDIDTYHQPVPPGSHLLLCSDGLSGAVPAEDIERIIADAATPQVACERLLDAANAAGGPDNITALLIQFPPA